jgi:hypothetical protein
MLPGAGAPGATPPAAPPPIPALAWHIAEGGESVGPFTPAQLAQAIAAGRVTRETLVWSAGMAGWQAASDVEALAGLFAPSPPPIPGA